MNADNVRTIAGVVSKHADNASNIAYLVSAIAHFVSETTYTFSCSTNRARRYIGILSSNAKYAGETAEDTGSNMDQYSVNSGTTSDTKDVICVNNKSAGELTM